MLGPDRFILILGIATRVLFPFFMQFGQNTVNVHSDKRLGMKNQGTDRVVPQMIQGT